MISLKRFQLIGYKEELNIMGELNASSLECKLE